MRGFGWSGLSTRGMVAGAPLAVIEAPDEPTLTSVSNGGQAGQIVTEWTAPASGHEVASYEILYDTQADFLSPAVLLVTGIETLTHTLTPLPPDTEIFACVRARNAAGASVFNTGGGLSATTL